MCGDAQCPLVPRQREIPWGHSSPVCGQDSFGGVAWLLERADPDATAGLAISVPSGAHYIHAWSTVGLAKVGQGWGPVAGGWVRGLCPLWAFPRPDQSSHPVAIIHRQEIPVVIKIPPTFIPPLVVYKVISIPKEGFEDFFPAPCF